MAKFKRHPYRMEPGEYRLIMLKGGELKRYAALICCKCGQNTVAVIESNAPMELAKGAIFNMVASEDGYTMNDGVVHCSECKDSDIVSQAYSAIYGDEEAGD